MTMTMNTSTNKAICDPVQFVDSLDPDVIRQELHVLEARQAALNLLYRAAVARQRREGRLEQKSQDG